MLIVLKEMKRSEQKGNERNRSEMIVANLYEVSQVSLDAKGNEKKRIETKRIEKKRIEPR